MCSFGTAKLTIKYEILAVFGELFYKNNNLYVFYEINQFFLTFFYAFE